MAVGSLQNVLTENQKSSFLVFDMQGRYLGAVEYTMGLKLEQTLLKMFHKPGIYLVRRGKNIQMVRVTP
jgi:hypothetical protein